MKRMKRKEIAEHLDKIGTLVANAEILAHISDGSEVSKEQADAAMVGLSVGIALGSGIIGGEYEANNPVVDAAHIIAVTLEVIAEHADD